VKTELVHPDGRRWEDLDLPVMPIGTGLSLSGKVTMLRVIDTFVHVDYDTGVAKQTVMLGLKNIHGG